MANAWTPERRARQSALIARWKPWTRASGPRTAAGKAASAGNAHKHGGRSRVFLVEMKQIRNYIRICRLTEQVIRHGLRNGGISPTALLVCQRLANESFAILCAGQAGQIIPGEQQKNRISANEVLANEASAKETLAQAPKTKEPCKILSAGQAGQFVPGEQQKKIESRPTKYWRALHRPRKLRSKHLGTPPAAARSDAVLRHYRQHAFSAGPPGSGQNHWLRAVGPGSHFAKAGLRKPCARH